MIAMRLTTLLRSLLLVAVLLLSSAPVHAATLDLAITAQATPDESPNPGMTFTPTITANVLNQSGDTSKTYDYQIYCDEKNDGSEPTGTRSNPQTVALNKFSYSYSGCTYSRDNPLNPFSSMTKYAKVIVNNGSCGVKCHKIAVVSIIINPPTKIAVTIKVGTTSGNGTVDSTITAKAVGGFTDQSSKFSFWCDNNSKTPGITPSGLISTPTVPAGQDEPNAANIPTCHYSHKASDGDNPSVFYPKVIVERGNSLNIDIVNAYDIGMVVVGPASQGISVGALHSYTNAARTLNNDVPPTYTLIPTPTSAVNGLSANLLVTDPIKLYPSGAAPSSGHPFYYYECNSLENPGITSNSGTGVLNQTGLSQTPAPPYAIPCVYQYQDIASEVAADNRLPHTAVAKVTAAIADNPTLCAGQTQFPAGAPVGAGAPDPRSCSTKAYSYVVFTIYPPVRVTITVLPEIPVSSRQYYRRSASLTANVTGGDPTATTNTYFYCDSQDNRIGPLQGTAPNQTLLPHTYVANSAVQPNDYGWYYRLMNVPRRSSFQWSCPAYAFTNDSTTTTRMFHPKVIVEKGSGTGSQAAHRYDYADTTFPIRVEPADTSGGSGGIQVKLTRTGTTDDNLVEAGHTKHKYQVAITQGIPDALIDYDLVFPDAVSAGGVAGATIQHIRGVALGATGAVTITTALGGAELKGEWRNGTADDQIKNVELNNGTQTVTIHGVTSRTSLSKPGDAVSVLKPVPTPSPSLPCASHICGLNYGSGSTSF
ncbi:MAG: hypothetical protein WCO52_01490 [bacterium]